MVSLLPLDDAQAQLLALAPKMATETIAVEAALGRVLGDDLQANRTQPPADLSAMDGYALGAGDGPWRLIGESRAGAPYLGSLDASETVRISTGAHLPSGADRVLIQENADVAGGEITAQSFPSQGQHVRPQGFDFAAGDTVLAKGTRIGPAQLALAMSAGHASLSVSRMPKLAVLDSGDELAANPEECAPDQIPASNGAMIAAMIAPLVGSVTRIGPIADDCYALADALHEAEDCDILITSGGASVGDHDLVQPALQDWGADIAFWKVAIRPGKPLMVATKGNRVVLGLPGNPVSSFVTCFLFALPLIRASLGIDDPLPKPVPATIRGSLGATSHRRAFLRGVIGGGEVREAASQDSSALRSLAEANCLIDRPANSPATVAGEQVSVFPLING